MISAIIIDDEKDAIENLQILLSSYCKGDIKIIGVADNMEDGVAYINRLKPDIVFLDIGLGDTSGFEMLKKIIYKDFFLIFVTAHHEFALEAFRYDALDYITKPIDPDLLVAVVEKVKKQNLVKKLSNQYEKIIRQVSQRRVQKIPIASNDGTTFVSTDEIIRMKSDGNYTNFYLIDGKKLIASKNLKSFEPSLDPDFFCRTHQSFIVNFRYLDKLYTKEGTFIITKDGEKTPVSRSHKVKVQEFIKRFLNQ